MIWLVCYAHLNFSCALIFQHTQIADPHISLQDKTDLRYAVRLRSVCEGNFNILINRLAVPVALFYFFLRIASSFGALRNSQVLVSPVKLPIETPSTKASTLPPRSLFT